MKNIFTGGLTIFFLLLIAAATPHLTSAGPGLSAIIAEDGLIGGVAEGKWIEAEDALKRLNGGEKYQLYTLTSSQGEFTGSKPEEDPVGCLMVKFTPELRSDEGTVAVGGPWNALPRAPKPQSSKQKVYVDAVRQILKEHGLAKAPVRITQALRIDLEGDGREEVLISATTPRENYPSPDPRKNDYSFVALRKIVGGKVKTSILVGDFFTKTKQEELPYIHNVLAVLDLNGDGVQEIIVRSAYYEGIGYEVFQAGDKENQVVMAYGCGA